MTTITPEKNGIVERKNYTIMEMARSMLKSKNLPNSFWGVTVVTIVYILNQIPKKVLQTITPKEAWSGHKPSIAHFHVFGFSAYVHVPIQKEKIGCQIPTLYLCGIFRFHQRIQIL